MKILIGICTQNRNNLLKKNLDSLGKIYLPDFIDLKVLIVDNTKKGHSRDLIRKFKKKKSFKHRITYQVVKRKGIPASRNELLKLAKKNNPKFMCFIDDDCIVDKFWLVNNLKIIKETNCDIVTGPQIHLEKSMKKFHFNFYKLLERSPKHKTKVSWAATNNVMFKFDIIKKLKIKFDKKMNFMGGSDQLFFKKMHQQGYSIIWNQKSKVYEYIHPERLNFLWFVKRNLRYGLSGVYIDRKIHGYFNGIIFSFIKFFLYLILTLIYLPLSIIKNIFFYKSAMYFSRATGRISGVFGVQTKEYI